MEGFDVAGSASFMYGCLMDTFDGNEFTLRIRLGNAEMQSPSDVANALRRSAEMLEEYGTDAPQSLLDVNGNRVGAWTVV